MAFKPAIYDALGALASAATVTATTYATAVAWPLTPSHYLNDSHKCALRVVFDVTALAAGGGTVTLVVRADTVSGMSSPVVVGTLAVTATGRYEVIVSLDTVDSVEADAAYIQSGIVLAGGTSPSVTYSAFVTKH